MTIEITLTDNAILSIFFYQLNFIQFKSIQL